MKNVCLWLLASLKCSRREGRRQNNSESPDVPESGINAYNMFAMFAEGCTQECLRGNTQNMFPTTTCLLCVRQPKRMRPTMLGQGCAATFGGHLLCLLRIRRVDDAEVCAAAEEGKAIRMPTNCASIHPVSAYPPSAVQEISSAGINPNAQEVDGAQTCADIQRQTSVIFERLFGNPLGD